MAGIKASSASKVMADGDTSAVDAESGYLVGEQITLSTLPAGTTWLWGVAKPASSTVRAELSDDSVATPTFVPDVAGEYVFTCTVDSVTGYVLRITVTAVAQTTALEAVRFSPLSNAQVAAPALGGAVFWSSSIGGMAVKNSSDATSALEIGSYDGRFDSPTASEIVASLTAGTLQTPKRYRITGSFVIDQILDIPSHVVIDATGARITTTLTPVVGLADDPANCLFRAVGVVGAYSSTLTATFSPGTAQLTVASTTGLTVGSWVKITSTNGSTKPLNYLIDDGVTASKLYQVKSIDSGTTFTVYGYCRYWQKTGSTIVSVTPPQNITWIGGSFDCSGGTIACAMYFKWAVGITIKNTEVTGFSRYPFEFVSALKTDLLGITHRGEINGLASFWQADSNSVKGLRGPGTASLVKHANGVARHLLSFRDRCCDTHVEDCEFSWATGGIHWLANDRTHIEHCWSHDLDGSQLSAVVGGRGITIDMAHWNPALEGMGCGITIRDVRAANNKDGNGHASGQCEFYIHDVSDGNFSGLTYVHNGANAQSHDVVVCADCATSKIYDIANTGGKVALKLEGTGIGVVRGVFQMGTTGTGGSTNDVVYIDTPSPTGIRLYDIVTANTGWIGFGPSFGETQLEVYDTQLDGAYPRIAKCVPVTNPTATATVRGAIWRLTGVVTNGFSEIAPDAGGPGRKCRIVNNSSFANGSKGLVELDPLGWAEERSPKFLPSPMLWLEAKTSQLSLNGKAVEYWFDEAGTVGDDAVGVAGPTYESNNGGRPAVKFNGTTQYFTVPDSVDFGATTAFTMVARLKRTVAGVRHTICAQYPSAGPWRFFAEISASNAIYSEWNNIGTATCAYTGGTSWTDVVIVYDGSLAAGSRVIHYINGVAQATTVSGVPTAVGNPSTSLYIGSNDAPAPAFPFDGSFRFFGLFGVALTATQVAAISAYPG